jgi:hypothetical protein
MTGAVNIPRDLRAAAIPAAAAIREAAAVTARKQLSLAKGPAQRSGPLFCAETWCRLACYCTSRR